ncbi:AMP-binding protein [Enterovibrio paralichthyis]|uniref:AMP-binding protein n=1 Tax=Enterovibrio paralichthyis TaxID=2853805 RepID=UPI001C445328|nr:AMP-binding protein [Enterovibrio paralichthyis]MBV7297785.1 AMP-binding protein [Enterovibrio paralichthyis]
MKHFGPLASLCLSGQAQQCIAIRDRHEITRETFIQQVTQLAQALSASPSQRWALAFEDSYLFATAFFACAHAGKAIVLPGNLQQGALSELSPHFDALLHDERSDDLTHFPCLSLPLERVSDSGEAPLAKITSLNLTLFTSGSSGSPKAVSKTLAQLQAELFELECQWGTLLAGTQIQSTVSHQHIYGLLFRVLWPLSAGRPFHSRDLVYPEQVCNRADKNQVLVSSPALLKRITEQGGGQYRAIFSSGGPLPFAAAQQNKQLLGILPLEVYGSTETGGIGFRQQTHENTSWQFFQGIDAQLDKESCLAILSPYIDPETWYQTADICEFGDGHTFTLKGRADRIVKIEEKRVSLAEVEQRLCQSPWVTDAFSLLRQENERQTIAAAVVLSAKGQQALTDNGAARFKLALRQHLRDWLEPVAIPRQWRFVDAIPQNTQGKRQVPAIEGLFTQH